MCCSLERQCQIAPHRHEFTHEWGGAANISQTQCAQSHHTREHKSHTARPRQMSGAHQRITVTDLCEGGRVCFRFHVNLHKLLHSEIARRRLLKLLEALAQRRVTHPHHLHNILLRSVEPVHPCGYEKSRATNPRRTTTHLKPVALHSAYKAHCCSADFVRSITEIHFAREPKDVQRRIDDGHASNVELEHELEVDRTESKHVDLKRVGKVQQHVRGLFVTADNVEAHGDDVLCLASLDKAVLHGKLKVPAHNDEDGPIMLSRGSEGRWQWRLSWPW
jgi:hypothetical protein